MSHKSGEMTAQPRHLSASNGVVPKPGTSDQSGAAGDFEQEMIAALGLSPTDPPPQRSASTPMALHLGQMNGENKRPIEQSQPQGNKASGMRSVSDMPAKKGPPVDKGLPVIPTEPFSVSLGTNNQIGQDQQGRKTPPLTIPSIRPVFDESPKPPSPPPKDDGLLTSNGHTVARQPSVSTLGADETGKRSSEEDGYERDPPSPLQPPQAQIVPVAEPQQNVERPVNGNSNPTHETGSSSHENSRSFVPSYPSEYATSAEVLESKRKSISGLPPSVPGVQSPLRNEVRYSPGTRSSMLSFGSFGKHSKGTRPSTPANGLQASESSSPAGNDESTFGKIKNFGRRRRASVGDLLSSLQSQGAQSSQGGQRKRALSRLSVCCIPKFLKIISLTLAGTIWTTRVSQAGK